MLPYSNNYAQRVFEILAPLIGDMMAQGVIKSQSAAIGKEVTSLVKADMPKLAEKVGKGLVVFLGSDSASKVCNRIAQIL
jgi:hypothetical protein